MKTQPTDAWLPRWFAFLCIFYFLAAGLVLLVLTTLVGPSFGYYPCAAFFAASSIAWYWPRIGASSSLPFVLVSAYWFVALRAWRWADQGGTVAGMAVVISFAIVICVVVLARRGAAWRPIFVSVAIILVSFVVEREFTNKLEIRSVEMSWSVDGKTPWASETQLDSKGLTPVIVYAKVDGGYCYDAVFSEALKQKLLQVGQSKIAVEYNEFKDFGRERGYNVRSIAGIRFNDDHRSLVADGEEYGGTSLEPVEDGRKYSAPQCPR